MQKLANDRFTIHDFWNKRLSIHCRSPLTHIHAQTTIEHCIYLESWKLSHFWKNINVFCIIIRILCWISAVFVCTKRRVCSSKSDRNFVWIQFILKSTDEREQERERVHYVLHIHSFNSDRILIVIADVGKEIARYHHHSNEIGFDCFEKRRLAKFAAISQSFQRYCALTKVRLISF